MTANQIMDFADKIAGEPNMFYETELELAEEKYKVLCELEKDFDSKKLKRQYRDVCEKQRLIGILKYQRLELMQEARMEKRGANYE